MGNLIEIASRAKKEIIERSTEGSKKVLDPATAD
jgi:hypothetical protein